MGSGRTGHRRGRGKPFVSISDWRPTGRLTTPYTLASLARQVPAARQGLSALRELGLGPPSLPDRGEIETMYVLGCGPSIARVTDRQWTRIDAGFSLGVNFFGIHPFTPNILSQERTKNMDPGLAGERRDARLTMLRALEAERASILWKDGSQWAIDDAAPLISATPELHHVALQWFRIVVHDQPDFSGALAACLRIERRWDLLNRGYALHLRSSVVYGALLGAALGVRRVVLAGVDLDTTDYFWDVDPSLIRPSTAAPPTAQTTPGRHSSETGTVSTSTSLRSLARALERGKTTWLEILNPSSVLAPHLPAARVV